MRKGRVNQKKETKRMSGHFHIDFPPTKLNRSTSENKMINKQSLAHAISTFTTQQ